MMLKFSVHDIVGIFCAVLSPAKLDDIAIRLFAHLFAGLLVCGITEKVVDWLG